MGITYGDYLIDSGYHDITPEQEREIEGCPNCGGEGVIYCCFEEYACVDPEGGCDLCERRCDWCRAEAA